MSGVIPKTTRDLRLAVIGLGYVGLPLAVAFAKKRPVLGFDSDPKRIDALKAGIRRRRPTRARQLLYRERAHADRRA